MGNFLLQSRYAYRALSSWLDWPSMLANILFRPILMLFLFAIIGRFVGSEATAQFYIVGLTAYSATTLLSGGIMQCLANDRDFGTLPFLFVSSGSRLSTYYSRSLFHYPTALLCFLVGIAAAVFLLGLDVSHTDWIGVVVVFLVIAFSVSGFALFLGSFSIAFQNWTVPSAFAETILLVMTGVIIPRNELPLGFRLVSEALPISHGLDGLRQAYAGAALPDIAVDLGLEAGIGVIYAILGFVVFRSIETYARRSGSYERG